GYKRQGRVGDLLGALVLSNETARPASSGDRRTGLATLRDGGFIDYADNAITPTDLVVVVTGDEFGPDSGAQGTLVGRLAATLSARGVGGVLVGRTGSAAGGSPIAIVRSDPSLANAVSTVDNIDQPTGLITTILALAAEADGTTGSYGTGPGATAITVGADGRPAA
ncbi:copper transporter, partial [Gordonia sp. GAMMA]|uniref:copper transporter n=1 Tax=Gordonia sp. GAMMA TaxID=2502241 RepID=UPI0010F5B981